MEEYDLKLTDLIDPDTMRRMQEAFSRMTGFASFTMDLDGVPVIEGTNYSEFCKYMHSSPSGYRQCRHCNKYVMDMAIREGRCVSYTCPAGLTEFAAPVMAEGRLVGYFIAGQVATEENGIPGPDKIKLVAAMNGLDPEKLADAAQRIYVTEKERIDRAAEFLYTVCDILSSIAYNKYRVYRANIEIEKTANMKSDFLANMSHEIRTPMNAVIGMAEMALREELPAAAREYISQIKSSGKTLLAIINDILDFSKIESGKMDIHEEEYEPMSILNDVSNILVTRLKEKDVELLLDVSPTLPGRMMGDSIRIRQVLLNIANNAVKFTSHGRIKVKVDYVKTANDEIELHTDVEDTGIGIRKQDINKLFQSFQQLDSKRNRNIEGTGLGLAISRQLLTLMHGSISVESEYSKGSTFSFVVPQTVVDWTPGIAIRAPETIRIESLITNQYVREQFRDSLSRLGIEHTELASEEELGAREDGNRHFLFVEMAKFSPVVEKYVRDNGELTAVLLINLYDKVGYCGIPNLVVVRKPLYELNIALILNGEKLYFEEEEESDKEFDFTAPDAKILIVDDNAINLTVAEGLLEPLQMKIDKALSGREALDKIAAYHYDIVFMDHMMPELDGVETTRLIRRFHPEYNDVPIIALTANAVDGTKEMFCQEGMNDFIAKPIEIRIMAAKVKKWLPSRKIKRGSGRNSALQEKNREAGSLSIGDLDVQAAMQLLGTEKLFRAVLKDYYRVIDKKVQQIKDFEEREDWKSYTIEVHALKSASRQIGANVLADKAAAMEKAGNEQDGKQIHECTGDMLRQYAGYKEILKPFCEEEPEPGKSPEHDPMPPADIGKLREYLEDMEAAVSDLDMDRMEAVIKKMEPYRYEGRQAELLSQLKEAVEEMDVDTCEVVLREWTEAVEE